MGLGAVVATFFQPLAPVAALGIGVNPLHLEVIEEIRLFIPPGELSRQLVHIGYQTRGAETNASMSTWLFIGRDGVENPEAVVCVWGDNKPLSIEVAKLTGHPVEVYYKAILKLRLPSGPGGGYNWFGAD